MQSCNATIFLFFLFFFSWFPYIGAYLQSFSGHFLVYDDSYSDFFWSWASCFVHWIQICFFSLGCFVLMVVKPLPFFLVHLEATLYFWEIPFQHSFKLQLWYSALKLLREAFIQQSSYARRFYQIASGGQDECIVNTYVTGVQPVNHSCTDWSLWQNCNSLSFGKTSLRTPPPHVSFQNKLASSKMRKLKADKLTSWQTHRLTNWQSD